MNPKSSIYQIINLQAPRFSILFIFYYLLPSYRTLETKYPKCCNLVPEYSSCQKACEQVSLSLPKDIRYQKLANVHALCPQKAVFWKCMNSIIDATDQANGWLGWPCCNLALKQNCFLSCVTSTSKSQLTKSCRQSDEISFYQCLKRQEEGEICCSNTANEDCKQACWRIFKKEASPTQDDKLYVERKCGFSDKHVLRCIQNYTKTTPARNPVENLKCCQESSNATCREKCKEILFNSTTEQEIVDKLNEVCGPTLPNNLLWQCFILNSDVSGNNDASLDTRNLDGDESYILDQQDMAHNGINRHMFLNNGEGNNDNLILKSGSSKSDYNGMDEEDNDMFRLRNNGDSQNRMGSMEHQENGMLYDKHHYHQTSKLDIAGLDAVKLQCCLKAVTQTCVDLCTKSYSLEANNNWSDFSEHCQYNPVETNLITCLSEVDEPCTLGCSIHLPFCGHLFNHRPLELYRSCKLASDNSAHELITSWFSASTISLPALDIPVLDIKECLPEQWRAIACVLEIKPCHPISHTSLICRSDCIKILNKCLNREKLMPGQSPEGLCNILSPVDPEQSCISVSEYMNSTFPTNPFNANINDPTNNLHDLYSHTDTNFLYSAIFNDNKPVYSSSLHPYNNLPSTMIGSYHYASSIFWPLVSPPFSHILKSMFAFHSNYPCTKSTEANVCRKESVCVIDRSLTCANTLPTELDMMLSNSQDTQTTGYFELPFSAQQCYSRAKTDHIKEGKEEYESNKHGQGSIVERNLGKRKLRGAFSESYHHQDNGDIKLRNGHYQHYSNIDTTIERRGGYACQSGCTLGEVSSFVIPHGSFVQLPINGKGLNCHRVCLCSPIRKNDLIRCHSINCYGINHCWIQDSVKMHLSQFTMDCNFCSCHNGKVVCTLRYCPSIFWTEEEKLSYTGLPCNCPHHYVPVCATNGKTYHSSCLAKCAGLTPDSYEYGACPSSGSNALADVCRPLSELDYMDPCGVKYSVYKNDKVIVFKKNDATGDNNNLACVPLRQVCLSSSIDNLKFISEKHNRHHFDNNNIKISISTCPQYLCLNKNLDCSNQNAGRSHATCSVFRDHDYKLFLPDTSESIQTSIRTTKCLKRLPFETYTRLTSGSEYNPYIQKQNVYKLSFLSNTQNDFSQMNPQPLLSQLYRQIDTSQEPVCGYNGETYDDECQASLNGALIDYAGPCLTTGIISSGSYGSQSIMLDNLMPNSNFDFNQVESTCPINVGGAGGRNSLCENVKNTVYLTEENMDFYRSDLENRGNRDWNERLNNKESNKRGDRKKKYTISCMGITPPGACCPVCAAEIRVLYSQEIVNSLAQETQFGPITVNQITAKLRRHLKVSECDLYGYLSLEKDLVFLVAPILSPLSMAKISDHISLKKREREGDDRVKERENEESRFVGNFEKGRNMIYLALKSLKKSLFDSKNDAKIQDSEKVDNIESKRRQFISSNLDLTDSPNLILLVQEGKSLDTNHTLHSQRLIDKEKLVVLSKSPFPTSPLHVEICNREARRLSALISSHNPTLMSELPMPILLGAKVRTSYASVSVSSKATTSLLSLNLGDIKYYYIILIIITMIKL
ncbi:uncharacterized protein LOC135927891 [Gordionus sp. m RMFG-2023]|uniref:uncharacterized protein LOC135927891 n=1 Tax=Gordionus sp. m RMFG-2023 TaxID=3053472 RepID=UPI0031FD80B0